MKLNTPRKGNIGASCYTFTQNTLNQLLLWQPDTLLLCNSPISFYQEIRAKLPNANIFYRSWAPDSTQQLWLDHNPTGHGREFAHQLIDQVLPMNDLTGVVLLNETSPLPNDLISLDEFQLSAIDELHRWGIAVGANALGVGCPQVAQALPPPFSVLKDATVLYLNRSLSAADFYVMHAYSSPNKSMDDPIDSPWYALRHRFVLANLKAAGFTHGPVIITESGGYFPWKGKITDVEMVRQLTWFQNQIEQDGIVGQCPFGLFDNNGQFPGFDYSGTNVLQLMAEHNATH